MSKRTDIIDGALAQSEDSGLVYTEVLGWVDLGHARGEDIKKLLRKMDEGEASIEEYYEVTYSQGMTAPYNLLRAGKMETWLIKKGRPLWERKSIALAMMMKLARKFEAFQNSFPYYHATDSGFSGEDLPSDLLGFYRAVTTPNPFSLLRPVSKAEALKRWDYYGKIGDWKNDSFCPLLFPDPEKFRNARPRKGVLPSFMNTIVPYNDFLSGNVILPEKDKTFFILGASNGRMEL
ncbi:hypothetical protein [Candidatus Pantoea multigeneris]|uniref:Uncharacterized protein n=1 Tax=Candidatus Pantoea multigeneris TaxID=2608357 RepID=A0ABX0R7G0_9GAMM|nr:hypothetical protein [Pantoea multigeneris]NIF20719.1 hypothetical protein [Pantoea multigeneris]